MSTSYHISPLKLEVPYKLLGEQPLRTLKNSFIYPASPSLIKRHFPTHVYEEYMKLRDTYLRSSGKIYDERLRDYQNEDVDFLVKSKNRANFNQQRLGKTPTTLVAVKQRAFEKLLIIAPKSTLISWQQECIKWLGQEAYLLRGPKQQRIRAYEREHIFLCTYEMASRDYLEMPNFDIIIIDEAHRLRNFKGQRSKYSPTMTKNIMQLSYRAKEKIPLTGTPAPNYSYNIFAILHLLFPKLFISRWAFIEYYYETEQEQYNWAGDTKTNILGFKPNKQQELQELLELISIQRKRKDHMKWLPPVDYHTLVIPMEPKQAKYYKELSKIWEIADSEIVCQGPLDLMIRQRQLAISPELLGLDAPSNKTQWILDFIEDYPDDQILIVSQFTSYLEALNKIIPNSKLLTGNTTTQERKHLETTFNNRQFPILLGNIDVVKEGMKLEMCNTIIFVDQSLTYEDNNQVQDRLLPTTPEIAEIKDRQQVIRLISKESVDEYLNHVLHNEKKPSVEIVNNYLKTLKKH